MDQLDDLAVFVAVAETGGFSAAARRLGATTAGTSKSVGRLEDRLGVRLFTRTTRRVVLTEEGTRFYERARDITEAMADAEEEVRSASRGLRGRIRIDLPVVFGRRHAVPLLLDFARRHPEVALDMRFDDRPSDLIGTGRDLAIRFGDLTDSGLRARRVGTARTVTVASPDYIAAHGRPGAIEDLDAHVCATFVFKGSGRAYRWRFEVDGEAVSFDTAQTLCVDDGEAHRSVALSGLAIVQDLRFHFQEDLRDGTLVEVLSHAAGAGMPIQVVHPEGRHLPARVRALIDHLVDGLDGFET
ncbi:LysR family transcriptional regulator [Jannaschia aquimarina]|uniref:DmlR_1 protein n=1 Tax=Jannaschia aquimarina TaxID=935700 RepID=A0A0D1CTI7_9RHOB|nr:LysR family transcriptional regulator [Jannaschia aquimarina]KIT18087.1 HTH-type transcriptional regulator DmlR [Jannaschia aquimarina]SNT40661.1 DNA-binding transcriptional regulator, LysR family [Jannaschia aquimarina]